VIKSPGADLPYPGPVEKREPRRVGRGAALAIAATLPAGTAVASGFDGVPTTFQVAMLIATCLLTGVAGLLQMISPGTPSPLKKSFATTESRLKNHGSAAGLPY
jgi:hypothetical protein